MSNSVFCWNISYKRIVADFSKVIRNNFAITLESGIDVGQGINVGPGKFVKKYNHRALNKRRA